MSDVLRTTRRKVKEEYQENYLETQSLLTRNPFLEWYDCRDPTRHKEESKPTKTLVTPDSASSSRSKVGRDEIPDTVEISRGAVFTLKSGGRSPSRTSLKSRTRDPTDPERAGGYRVFDDKKTDHGSYNRDGCAHGTTVPKELERPVTSP